MSTGKTENLELNQWVLDDPFLMEEVNEDNRKIDAGLGMMAMKKIAHIVTTQQAQKIDLALGEIDWSRYMELYIYFSPIHNRPGESQIYCDILVNNRTGENLYRDRNNYRAALYQYLEYTYNPSSSAKIPPYKLTVFSCTDECAFALENNSVSSGTAYYPAIAAVSAYGKPLALSELQTINFKMWRYSDETPVYALPGTEIFIYGVKK